MRFKKRPVTIEARQFVNDDQGMEIRRWVGRENCDVVMAEGEPETVSHLLIHTLEGSMRADRGDWIIRGVQGEFYPCKPGIFDESYATEQEWDSSYAPKPADVEAPVNDGPEGWIERQEEERRAWAVSTSVEFGPSDPLAFAKEIVDFVKNGDKDTDLNDVEATDTFYLLMGERINQHLKLDDLYYHDTAENVIAEFLIDSVDSLAKNGVRLKDGKRLEEDA